VDDDLGQVTYYSDIPAILAEQGIINVEQRETWTQMIGFRNILVHEYGDVDRRIVYIVLQNRLQDIRQFSEIFARYL